MVDAETLHRHTVQQALQPQTQTPRAPAIYHRDSAGVVHTCKQAMSGPGKVLVWTLCLQDIPLNRTFTADGPAPSVTCPECREYACDDDYADCLNRWHKTLDSTLAVRRGFRR
jgi:hypothetical protein